MDVNAIASYFGKVELFRILLPLALVFCFAKFLGLVARKLQMPQVVGEIVAGLLLGPCVFNLIDISNPEYGLSIRSIAEVGVIMLMFVYSNCSPLSLSSSMMCLEPVMKY